jgi:hypothetical protein
VKHGTLAGAAIAIVLLASVPACDRKPRLVPASADSLSLSQDSLSIRTRTAQHAWETGEPDHAATLTANVVRDRLVASASADWDDRARLLLDSLGIGAEVEGQRQTIVVNLFSRAEMDGGSWPFLVWNETDGPRVQALEGRGMRLLGVTSRPAESATDQPQIAVLWGKRGAAGQQPLLLTFRHARGGRWDLTQTLGPDSLGGTGTGQFDETDLVTRTFKATPWFDECATCPHVYHERRFRWGPQGFARVDDRIVPSPYATFTSFVGALVDGDRESAERWVSDPSLVDFARRYEWHDSGLGRWRPAPGTEANAPEMIFFRGRSDAFRVTFQPRGAGWVLLGFEATTRSVE